MTVVLSLVVLSMAFLPVEEGAPSATQAAGADDAVPSPTGENDVVLLQTAFSLRQNVDELTAGGKRKSQRAPLSDRKTLHSSRGNGSDPPQEPGRASASGLDNGSFPSAVSSGPACEDGRWMLVSHHKTGTFMTQDALDAMWPLLNCGQDADNASHYASLPWFGYVGGAKEVKEHYSGRCLAHFERNIFEIVVSGYVYHLSTDEKWVYVPMMIGLGHENLNRISAELFGPGLKEAPVWFAWHVRGISFLANSTTEGRYAGLLPTPLDETETFQAYLNRVDVKAGLLASAILFNEVWYPSLAALHELVASHPDCSINVCLSAFDALPSCRATWHGLLGTLGLPRQALPSLSLMAATSCPAVADLQEHAGTALAKHKHLALPALPELMQMLRRIDSDVLDAALAAEAAAIPCPASERYLGRSRSKLT